MDHESSKADPRTGKRYYYHATLLRRIVVFVLRLIFRLFMRMEVYGLGHLPMHGPVVIASNHVTNFDVFPMQLSLPRPIFFMGKAELFEFAPLDWALRQLGAFPVRRGEKDGWAMAHARHVLEHGAMLGMFPEGTRNKGLGLGVAKTGTARLAIETGAPIVPMVITGTDRFFERFPRRTRITVRLLEPLLPGSEDSPLALTDRMMFHMAASLPEEMRGVYAELPKYFQRRTR